MQSTGRDHAEADRAVTVGERTGDVDALKHCRTARGHQTATGQTGQCAGYSNPSLTRIRSGAWRARMAIPAAVQGNLRQALPSTVGGPVPCVGVPAPARSQSCLRWVAGAAGASHCCATDQLLRGAYCEPAGAFRGGSGHGHGVDVCSHSSDS
jgi:hypothetical protein